MVEDFKDLFVLDESCHGQIQGSSAMYLINVDFLRKGSRVVLRP